MHNMSTSSFLRGTSTSSWSPCPRVKPIPRMRRSIIWGVEQLRNSLMQASAWRAMPRQGWRHICWAPQRGPHIISCTRNTYVWFRTIYVVRATWPTFLCAEVLKLQLDTNRWLPTWGGQPTRSYWAKTIQPSPGGGVIQYIIRIHIHRSQLPLRLV